MKGERGVFYSVKHTVGSRRVEHDLSESLLEPYSYDTSKKRRSVEADAKQIGSGGEGVGTTSEREC